MQEPKQILTVARLHWKKGLDYTLRALALLKQAGFDFQYTIVGIGEHYEYLVYLSRLLGINDRVRFIGKQSPLEIRNHMQHSDIYIQYSVQEGFCNAVLEAQAMGLLCVVSNAEGLDENVLDDETGWVVPKRQPEALASKLMDILQLPEAKTMTVRQQAVARVQQEFHVQAHHRAFQRFYSN